MSDDLFDQLHMSQLPTAFHDTYDNSLQENNYLKIVINLVYRDLFLLSNRTDNLRHDVFTLE